MKRSVLIHGVPIAYGHGEFLLNFYIRLKRME